jgi:hypothetical protein
MVVLAGQLTLKRKGFLFNPFGVRQDRRSFICQYETISRPLEQHLSNRLLQRAKPTSHRGLALPDASRRGAERACPGNRQENTNITPIHGG